MVYYWLQEGREGGQKSQKPAYVIHGCSLAKLGCSYSFWKHIPAILEGSQVYSLFSYTVESLCWNLKLTSFFKRASQSSKKVIMDKVRFFCYTAKKKLERLQFSASSLFFKIWSACSCEFKAYFWTFWGLYHLLFDLETIGVN